MRLVLMAGTQEARTIAQKLARETRVNASVSLAQSERVPIDFGLPTRIGGWGSAENFRDWLQAEKVDAVVDATHPFAMNISHHINDICDELNIKHVQLLREPWVPADGDNWVFLDREDQAASHIPEGATVFIATGRAGMAGFENLKNRRVYCRVNDRIDDPFPFDDGAFLLRTPPFTVEGEIKLFQTLGVDWVIERNSGGPGSFPKIEAARRLGLPVAMLHRPVQPGGAKVETVAEVMSWINHLI